MGGPLGGRAPEGLNRNLRDVDIRVYLRASHNHYYCAINQRIMGSCALYIILARVGFRCVHKVVNIDHVCD